MGEAQVNKNFFILKLLLSDVAKSTLQMVLLFLKREHQDMATVSNVVERGTGVLRIKLQP